MYFKSEREILLEMIEYAEQNNLITVNEDIINKINEGKSTENQYVLILSTTAYIIHELSEKIKSRYTNSNINTASGEALDEFGSLFGIPRVPAKPALVEIQLTLAGIESEDITIPKGTPIITDELFENTEYTVSKDYTVNSGVTSINIIAESVNYGYTTPLPAGTVKGVEDFPLFEATNESAGTSGGNIEEDDDYRERLRNWSLSLNRGTKQSFINYLAQLDSVEDYNLIPQYDGVGTLKIVLKTLPEQLDSIREGIQENCMLYTDDPVVCVINDEELITDLDAIITVDPDKKINLTESELLELVSSQILTFINGGYDREGRIYKGLRIGQPFNPSQCIAFVLNQIPELENIVLSAESPVTVNGTSKLTIQSVEVAVE